MVPKKIFTGGANDSRTLRFSNNSYIDTSGSLLMRTIPICESKNCAESLMNLDGMLFCWCSISTKKFNKASSCCELKERYYSGKLRIFAYVLESGSGEALQLSSSCLNFRLRGFFCLPIMSLSGRMAKISIPTWRQRWKRQLRHAFLWSLSIEQFLENRHW